jgi:hypothetical protein
MIFNASLPTLPRVGSWIIDGLQKPDQRRSDEGHSEESDDQ